MDWRPTSPPRQDGRIFAVTGGNAGIGYFISEQLASTGATGDCRRLTSNPLTIAAWTLRWCAAQADTRIRLMSTPIGDAAHPSLVQASAASLGAELAVPAEHAIVAAAQLTVTTDDRIDQLIAWARGAPQSQV